MILTRLLVWDSSILKFPRHHIDLLAAHMRLHGYREDYPIQVMPVGDRFLVILGRARSLAASQAGIETLPAIVHEYLSNLEIMEFRVKS